LFPFLQEATQFALSGANIVPHFDVAQNLWAVNYDKNKIGQMEVTKDMLESLGYSVVGKADGKDAIAFVADEVKANRSIAGIILDLTIPGGMGGKETIKEMRQLSPAIPIFVTSGYAEDPVMANSKEYGFTASICKPFNMSELTEMLGKHLKNKNVIAL
jgi:CheY-like chemotaxis protein